MYLPVRVVVVVIIDALDQRLLAVDQQHAVADFDLAETQMRGCVIPPSGVRSVTTSVYRLGVSADHFSGASTVLHKAHLCARRGRLPQVFSAFAELAHQRRLGKTGFPGGIEQLHLQPCTPCIPRRESQL